MNGTGLPLATPFGEVGDVDHAALAALVTRVEERGVDFIVLCGSNSKAPLLTAGERTAGVETVADYASVPVLAGAGAKGRCETLELTRRAAAAGADAALVVTPYYFDHGSDALESYYRTVAAGQEKWRHWTVDAPSPRPQRIVDTPTTHRRYAHNAPSIHRR